MMNDVNDDYRDLVSKLIDIKIKKKAPSILRELVQELMAVSNDVSINISELDVIKKHSFDWEIVVHYLRYVELLKKGEDISLGLGSSHEELELELINQVREKVPFLEVIDGTEIKTSSKTMQSFTASISDEEEEEDSFDVANIPDEYSLDNDGAIYY